MATTIEIGRAANRQQYLSLAQAMQEAITGKPQESEVDESHLEIRRGRETESPHTGVRFQRCGGGRRIIRRQNGGA